MITGPAPTALSPSNAILANPRNPSASARAQGASAARVARPTESEPDATPTKIESPPIASRASRHIVSLLQNKNQSSCLGKTARNHPTPQTCVEPEFGSAQMDTPNPPPAAPASRPTRRRTDSPAKRNRLPSSGSMTKPASQHERSTHDDASSRRNRFDSRPLAYDSSYRRGTPNDPSHSGLLTRFCSRLLDAARNWDHITSANRCNARRHFRVVDSETAKSIPARFSNVEAAHPIELDTCLDDVDFRAALRVTMSRPRHPASLSLHVTLRATRSCFLPTERHREGLTKSPDISSEWLKPSPSSTPRAVAQIRSTSDLHPTVAKHESSRRPTAPGVHPHRSRSST